jgi:RNA polymerase sigma-70 factor (ECF subfamily)
MQELELSIIQKAAKGDNKAFKSLYDFYVPFVWRILFRMTGGDQALAQELVQETFVHVNRSLKNFQERSAFSTWVYRIAYNAGMNLMSRIRRFPTQSFDEEHGTWEHRDPYESKELVKIILDELNADERFLLTAREVDGLSYEELAEILNSTPGAVRTRLHRIKETVKSRFQPDLQMEVNDEK